MIIKLKFDIKEILYLIKFIWYTISNFIYDFKKYVSKKYYEYYI